METNAKEEMALAHGPGAKRAAPLQAAPLQRTEILVGSIDWSPSALEKIEEGVFTVSVGGHFLDCAWSIVMLCDHFLGHDFGPKTALSSYVALTRENLNRYDLFFEEARWPSIRFSSFSKTRNPGLAEYEFSVDAILSSL